MKSFQIKINKENIDSFYKVCEKYKINFPLEPEIYYTEPQENLVVYNLLQNGEDWQPSLSSQENLTPLYVEANIPIYIIFNNKPFKKKFLKEIASSFNVTVTHKYNSIYYDGVEIKIKILCEQGIVVILPRDSKPFLNDTKKTINQIIKYIGDHINEL